MLILKTLPEIYDQVRLPGTDRVARVILIDHAKQTVTVEDGDGHRADFSWDDDLELVRFSRTRVIPGTPDLLIEIIANTAKMDCIEHEAARKQAEAIFA